MAQQGWHNDHSSGSGVGSILLLLFLMALAAAGGWVLGNDELLGRAGARGENPSASAAPASPVQPAAVPTQPSLGCASGCCTYTYALSPSYTGVDGHAGLRAHSHCNCASETYAYPSDSNPAAAYAYTHPSHRNPAANSYANA